MPGRLPHPPLHALVRNGTIPGVFTCQTHNFGVPMMTSHGAKAIERNPRLDSAKALQICCPHKTPVEPGELDHAPASPKVVAQVSK